MNWPEIDRNQTELLRRDRLDDARNQLVDIYQEAKRNSNLPNVVHAATRIASFYSTLPKVENLELARFYYQEAENASGGAQSKLNTAMFLFHALESPNQTLAKLNEILTDDTIRSDPGAYFHALCLQGECYVRIDQRDNIRLLLAKLLRIAMLRKNGVVYGDAFDLLRQLISRGDSLLECAELLDFFLTAPMSPRSLETAKELRQRINVER